MSDKHEEVSSRDLLKRALAPLAARLAFLAMAAVAPIVIGEAVQEPRASASASTEARADFDRRHFDLYASLGAPALDRVLAKLDHSTMSVGGDRPIDIRMGAVSAAFRPGYPAVAVPAVARDRMTGAETEIMVEAKLLIEEASEAGGASLHTVPVRLVPQRRWGLHNLARWDFARRLRDIDAADLPEAAPLPIAAEAAGWEGEVADSGPRGALAPAYPASAPIAGGFPPARRSIDARA